MFVELLEDGKFNGPFHWCKIPRSQSTPGPGPARSHTIISPQSGWNLLLGAAIKTSLTKCQLTAVRIIQDHLNGGEK